MPMQAQRGHGGITPIHLQPRYFKGVAAQHSTVVTLHLGKTQYRAPQGFDRWTVQPIASRSTDYYPGQPLSVSRVPETIPKQSKNCFEL